MGCIKMNKEENPVALAVIIFWEVIEFRQGVAYTGLEMLGMRGRELADLEKVVTFLK